MAPARTYWGEGTVWGPATEGQTVGVWSSSAPTSGIPKARAAVGGVAMPLVGASWRHGRPGWFASLEPTSATITVLGAVTAEPGTDVMIVSDAGVHWRGYVQTVATMETLGAATVTTIGAVDVLARNAEARAAFLFAAGPGMTLTELVTEAFEDVGLTAPAITFASSTRAEPSSGLASPDFEGTLPEVLGLIERSSNAVFLFRPDGGLEILLRASLDQASVEVVPLDGDDAPREWQTLRDPTSVINHWHLVSEEATELDVEDTTSIALYGRHTYEVSPDFMYSNGDNFTTGLRTAMAELRTVVPRAAFPVKSYGQLVPWLLPLAFVSRDDVLYQVLQVEHSVSVEAWDVAMYLDSTQSAIEDEPEPDPDDPPDPEVTIEEQTYTADRDAVVVKSSGNNLGAGQGDRLHVGYYAGVRARTLVHFAMTPSGPAAGATGIRKATLRLKTSTQVDFAFGSNPKVVVQRITESWVEGSFTPSGGTDWSVDNAPTVWPGPSVTTAGQVTKEITESENTWTTYDVTDIAREWFESGVNHGVRVRAVNEDWAGNATEFQSTEGGSNDPELIVKWEVPV